MLRFKSAIFPSEEDKKRFSLSSKAWSPEGGKEKSCERRAAPHKDNNKITVQSITKSGSQKGCTPQGNKVNRG